MDPYYTEPDGNKKKYYEELKRRIQETYFERGIVKLNMEIINKRQI